MKREKRTQFSLPESKHTHTNQITKKNCQIELEMKFFIFVVESLIQMDGKILQNKIKINDEQKKINFDERH